MPDEGNGWSEYSRLVLKELETLAASIQSLNSEIQELKQEIARMREREDRVDELRAWKEKVDEVSGRGVGLEAVKNEVSKLNGSVRVFSKVEEGTTFVISLPIYL